MEFEEIEPNASCEVEVKVKSIECKMLNGRKVRVKAILEASRQVSFLCCIGLGLALLGHYGRFLVPLLAHILHKWNVPQLGLALMKM